MAWAEARPASERPAKSARAASLFINGLLDGCTGTSGGCDAHAHLLICSLCARSMVAEFPAERVGGKLVGVNGKVPGVPGCFPETRVHGHWRAPLWRSAGIN